MKGSQESRREDVYLVYRKTLWYTHSQVNSWCTKSSSFGPEKVPNGWNPWNANVFLCQSVFLLFSPRILNLGYTCKKELLKSLNIETALPESPELRSGVGFKYLYVLELRSYSNAQSSLACDPGSIIASSVEDDLHADVDPAAGGAELKLGEQGPFFLPFSLFPLHGLWFSRSVKDS